jgi:hypothetical protein
VGKELVLGILWNRIKGDGGRGLVDGTRCGVVSFFDGKLCTNGSSRRGYNSTIIRVMYI